MGCGEQGGSSVVEAGFSRELGSTVELGCIVELGIAGAGGDVSAFPAGERVPGQAVSRTALREFKERGGECPWWEEFLALRAEGWTWRKAAFIAWAASPVERRWPGTQEELARECLGLRSDRVIRKWRVKDPEVELRIARLQVEPLFRHRRDVIEALVAVARTADPKCHADRRLFLEMTGDYRPRGALELGGEVDVAVGLGNVTDEELEAIEGALRGEAEGGGEAE